MTARIIPFGAGVISLRQTRADTAERTPTKQPLGPCIEKLPEHSCPTSSSAGGTVQTPEKPAAVPHLITARTLARRRLRWLLQRSVEGEGR